MLLELVLSINRASFRCFGGFLQSNMGPVYALIQRAAVHGTDRALGPGSRRYQLSEDTVKFCKQASHLFACEEFEKVQYEFGGEILICSAKDGCDKMVRELLAAGVHPESTRERGEFPTYAAAFSGHSKVLEVLAEAGADKNRV